MQSLFRYIFLKKVLLKGDNPVDEGGASGNVSKLHFFVGAIAVIQGQILRAHFYYRSIVYLVVLLS